MRPLLLLDVDGVVNAFPWQAVTGHRLIPAARDPWGGQWRVHRVHGYRITVAEHCLSELRRLAETTDVQWLTTWEHHDAYRALADTLDLPDWPVYARDPDPVSHRNVWWKYDAVRDGHDPDRPLVWLDDEIGGVGPGRLAAHRWCKAHDGHVLGLPPDEETGLTQVHFAAIRKFLDRTQGGPDA